MMSCGSVPARNSSGLSISVAAMAVIVPMVSGPVGPFCAWYGW